MIQVLNLKQINGVIVNKNLSKENLNDNISKEFFDKVSYNKNLKKSIITFLISPQKNNNKYVGITKYFIEENYNLNIYFYTKGKLPNFTSRNKVNIYISEDDDGLENLTKLLNSSDILIDNLFEWDQISEIDDNLKLIIQKVLEAKKVSRRLKIISLGAPTGVDPDTGNVNEIAIKADITHSVGFPFKGFFLYPGADYIGKLEILDIGIKEKKDDYSNISLMTQKDVIYKLPKRPSWAHKGTFGKMLVVAGSDQYPGSAYLSTMGAYRSGVGVVTLALPKSLQKTISKLSIESTFLILPENSNKIDIKKSAEIIIKQSKDYDSLLIGCGLGISNQMYDLVSKILISKENLPPTVIDADGLNILSKIDKWWKKTKNNLILTPHPGELSSLIKIPKEEIVKNKFEIAIESSKKFNKIIILKGAYTIIATPEGKIIVEPFANPTLSTAGTGDIKSGIIGSLLAQGLNLIDAATIGVYIHGLVGDKARKKIGNRGTIASDLIKFIPKVLKELDEKLC